MIPPHPDASAADTAPAVDAASAVDHASAINAPFLATDIGGTHARLALVRAAGDGTIEVLHQHAYACADVAGLDAIVGAFLARPEVPPVRAAAIGCTGMQHGDMLFSTNLPWSVSLADLRALGLDEVAVVNDFVALAHAEQCMDHAHAPLLGPDTDAPPPGPALVFGPGTGLGAALRVPHGGQTLVLASEVGKAAFAPGNARESAVLDVLRVQAAHVANDQIVSGPGLLKLYRALCAVDGGTPVHRDPADVVDAAQARSDALAAEAVRIFCEAMGGILGDTVLTTGATRVFLAGGIVQKIRPLLDASGFRARFLDKGAMRPALERVPIRLIEHPHRGVIGAATWFLRGRAAPVAAMPHAIARPV